MVKAIATQNGWQEAMLDNIAILAKKSWKVGDESLPYIGLEHTV